MEAITFQSFEKEWIIKMDKSQFSPDFVAKLLKRVRMEWAVKQAAFDPALASTVAQQAEQNWWEQHGDAFLKDVQK